MVGAKTRLEAAERSNEQSWQAGLDLATLDQHYAEFKRHASKLEDLAEVIQNEDEDRQYDRLDLLADVRHLLVRIQNTKSTTFLIIC